jgi:putative component of toxin-antitoxin plasmid stabilization module
MIVIQEYMDERGRSSFGRWFDGLSSGAAAIVTVALARLADGNTSNVKSVGAGLQALFRMGRPDYRGASRRRNQTEARARYRPSAGPLARLQGAESEGLGPVDSWEAFWMRSEWTWGLRLWEADTLVSASEGACPGSIFISPRSGAAILAHDVDRSSRKPDGLLRENAFVLDRNPSRPERLPTIRRA